ncbi:MAG: TadE/TadG family type IV pilus assembly protein [Paracoccaceae bacterium]
MRALLARMKFRLRAAARSEEGSSTIPFVIFAPFFLILVVSSVEMGVLMVRHVMLERAVDLTVRGLRLGTYTPPNHDTIRRDICNLAGVIPNCLNALLVELRPVSKVTWQPLSSGPTCVDRAAVVQPVTTFTSGTGDEMMLIRACAKFVPLFPMSGLGFALPKDNTGAYALVAATAFVNEPTPGG